MAKYDVLVQRNHYALIVVEANDKNDAIDRARTQLDSSDESIWTVESGSPFGYNYLIVSPSMNVAAE